jgi:hypothetical protein
MAAQSMEGLDDSSLQSVGVRGLENVVAVEILIVRGQASNDVQHFAHHCDHGGIGFLPCVTPLLHNAEKRRSRRLGAR